MCASSEGSLDTKSPSHIQLLSAATLLIAACALLGWAIGFDPLTQLFVGWATLKANTAVAIALLSFALLVRAALWRTLAALFAGGIAGVSLFEWLTGIGIGIDEILVADPASSAAGQPPGRMAAATAIGLLSIALAALVSSRWALLAQLAALLALVIGWVALVGYATELGPLWSVWSPFATDLPGVVFKVWDRWFVGAGYSWHLDGETLEEIALPGGERLLTARGRADDDVWAVGGTAGPALLHWDGASWSAVDVDPRCTAQPLNGVWTAPGEDVWIAGNSGAMGRFDGTRWECVFPPITGEHFHAVWQHAGEMFFVGGNLFDTEDNYGTVGHYAEPALGELAITICEGGV